MLDKGKEEQYPLEEIRAVHIGEDMTYPTSYFSLPDWPLPYLDGVLVPNGLVRDRIAKLAQEIYKVYRAEKRLTFVIMMTVSQTEHIIGRRPVL